jgi:hypothetical protein
MTSSEIWLSPLTDDPPTMLPHKIISPTTPLMSLAWKFWNLRVIRGLEQTSFANAIFFSIAKTKAH